MDSSHSSPPGAVIILEVEATHRAEGRQHTLDAVARNTGTAAACYLWVPQCALQPWTDRMEGPSGEIQPHEPMGYCQPCGWDRLDPGEAITHTFTWDERVWEGSWGDAQAHDAPAGRYRWTATIHAWAEGGQACIDTLSAEDSVEIDVVR